MIKKMVVIGLFCSILSLLLGACGGATSASGATNVSGPQAHMNDADFVQHTITIQKGQSVTLVDDTATVHYIFNGQWTADGQQKQGGEPGAPKVQLQFQGNDSQVVGPFNTAGTFHLYCSIHPNMNLTVTVQ